METLPPVRPVIVFNIAFRTGRKGYSSTEFFLLVMRIAILSRNPDLFSTSRLKEAALERGHQVRVIDYVHCHMNIATSHPSIYLGAEELNNFDAIIPRIGARHTFFGTAVVRQFEMMGVYCLNQSVAITRSRDKLRSLQLLARKGLGLPITACAKHPEAFGHLIKLCGGAPLIIKLVEGTQGMGVVLAETQQAAESVIEAFSGLQADILVQQFIAESKGADIRAFVVGDKVIGAMRRQAKEGDFRSNLHRGGVGVKEKITSIERKIAVEATRIMGLKVAGVDLLRSKSGPLIMEVNSSPGLEGIEKTTKIDVASQIIEFIEKDASRASSRSTNGG